MNRTDLADPTAGILATLEESVSSHPPGELPTPDAATVRRSIAIALEDGALLAIASARAEGVGDHGSEQIAGALAEPGTRALGIGEVLLSTEYGPDGIQRRATLELRSGDDSERPVRGAGRLIAATRLELPGATSDLAYFEWSIAGRAGIGRYEIIRSV